MADVEQAGASSRLCHKRPEVCADGIGDAGQRAHRRVHGARLKALPPLRVDPRRVGSVFLSEARRHPCVANATAKLTLDVLDNLRSHRTSIR